MKKIISFGIGLLFFVSNVYALDVGVGAKVGTNGVGIDLSVGLTRNINLRLTAAAIDIDDEDETFSVGDSGADGDIDAELDFDYGATALLIDWHVFDGGFRLTAGILKNHGKADITGELQSSITIDGQPLDPDDISGDIGGEVSLADSYQPYIGIGWGRGAGGDGGFSLSVDVGVALLDPGVDFDATVNAGGPNGLNQAELDALLSEIESDAEDDLDDLEVWPVLAIGVNYAF